MFIVNPYIYSTAFTNEKSLLFDGVDEAGDFGSVSWDSMFSENVAGKYSISVWIKYLGDDGYIINDIHPSFNNYGLYLRLVSGQVRWRSSSAAVAGSEIVSTTTLTIGNWYHIFCAYDNTLGTENMALYINGVKESTTTQGLGNPTNYTGIHIMQRNNGLEELNANLKDLAFFGTDLRAEIANIYNSGVPSDLNNLSEPPKHWYRCGDSVGDTNTTIKDVGSASTLYDMPLINMESGDIVSDVPS